MAHSEACPPGHRGLRPTHTSPDAAPLPLVHSRLLSTLVACPQLLAGLSTLGTACRFVNISQALKR